MMKPTGEAMKIKFLFLFALAVLPQMLAAGTKSPLDLSIGNELYAACTNKDEHFTIACHAYIEGVTEGYYETAEAWQNVSMPKGVSYGQIDDVAKNYLTNHPEKRHLRSALLIIQALHEAWPAK
jgi:Rap1a immunity proteins